MTESSPSSDRQTHNRGAAPGTPRWVKVFLIVATIVVVVFAIVHLAGGGTGSHLP